MSKTDYNPRDITDILTFTQNVVVKKREVQTEEDVLQLAERIGLHSMSNITALADHFTHNTVPYALPLAWSENRYLRNHRAFTVTVSIPSKPANEFMDKIERDLSTPSPESKPMIRTLRIGELDTLTLAYEVFDHPNPLANGIYGAMGAYELLSLMNKLYPDHPSKNIDALCFNYSTVRKYLKRNASFPVRVLA